jgi:hypothetical protein
MFQTNNYITYLSRNTLSASIQNNGHKHTEETKKKAFGNSKNRKTPNPMSIPYKVTQTDGKIINSLLKEDVKEIYGLDEREWKTLYAFCSRNSKDIHKKMGIRIDADR